MAGRPPRDSKRPSKYEPEDWRQGGRKKAKKRATMDLAWATSYTDAAPELEETLSHIHITEHDPAIILNWDIEALQDFVARAIVNGAAPNPPARPRWLRTFPPTIASFTDDLVTFLAEVAGGRFGIIMLAPNNMDQYGNVWERIGVLEQDQFMQTNFATAPPNQRLARTGFLLDNRRVLQPLARARVAPEPPSRQIFA